MISFAQFTSTSKQSSDRKPGDPKSQQKVYSVSPKNALKMSIFWRAWMAEVRKSYLEIMLNNFSGVFIMFQLAIFFLFFFFFSYHKSYAMLYISDDAFLAKAAIVQSIMNGSSRMVFGFMYDKLGFKVKPTQTISDHAPKFALISLPTLQHSFFIQSFCSAALCLIFVNLMLFEGNEVGAKVFYIIISSIIYGILPGE